MKSCFDVRLPDGSEMRQITLNLPGRHNAQNALAAVAVGWELGLRPTNMRQSFQHFQGIGRRAQPLGALCFEGGKAELFDDYGHHPREVAATLDAISAGRPDNRLVVVFQPHRYSRTQELFDDFVQVLSDQAHAYICDVYPAGEQAISGASGQALCQAIRVRGVSNPIYIADVEDMKNVLAPIVQDGDVVLTLGAGSIGRVVREMAEELQRGEV